MIRIGVNALYLIPREVGGTEIYLRNLLQALAAIDSENNYVIFTNHEADAALVPQQANFVRAPQPVRARFRPARILWEQFGLPFAARKHHLNVLFNSGFTGPTFCACPMVTMFHDLQHKRHPENFRWFDLPFWNLLLGTTAWRSRGIITGSMASHDDFERYYRRESEVIHYGVEREFFEIAKHREPQDFILCVSTSHPHKNLQRLLRVHSQIKDAPALILTGVRGYDAEEVESLAGPSVHIRGWIPREQLYELYRGALGLIYPSTFEGFGMPVLEAMAACVPVACSDIPPLHEVARSTVHFFDPASDRELRDALLLLASGKISTDAAQRRAQQFSWEKTARATLDYLKRCSS
ncbi:MAG TPA: glycosyltransferase family 1 protein [Bryobacteraceae bacterium]|nr:glycosyltransferase family 1 protein [Bryobacteraceae bacterium]